MQFGAWQWLAAMTSAKPDSPTVSAPMHWQSVGLHDDASISPAGNVDWKIWTSSPSSDPTPWTTSNSMWPQALAQPPPEQPLSQPFAAHSTCSMSAYLSSSQSS